MQVTVAPVLYPSTVKLSGTSDGVFQDQNIGLNIVSNEGTVTPSKYSDGSIRKFIHISTQDTTVAPGPMVSDQRDLRAWFLESMEVFIWCQKLGTAPDITQRFPFPVVSQAPNGAPDQSGSMSSSLSFDLSAQVGTFGGTPTTSAGGGVQIGSSFSRSIADFIFENHSDPTYLHHVYHLAQSGSGKPYNPGSPMDSFGGNNFLEVQMAEVPALAKSNFPSLSQVVFMVDPGQFPDETVEVVIKFQANMVGIRQWDIFGGGKIGKGSVSEYIGFAVNLSGAIP